MITFVVAEFCNIELTGQTWGMFFSVTYQVFCFVFNFTVGSQIRDMNHKSIINRLISTQVAEKYKISTYCCSHEKEKKGLNAALR